MLNFPNPYPNELMYSTIARAGVHHAITSPKQLLDEVFSNRKVVATIDLPNHLLSVLEHLPPNYTLEKLVYEHTLFPLYALFSPENTRLRCLKWMEIQSKGSIHLALGVSASRVKQVSTLRYCSQCLKDQYSQYGELFWSRVWQIQGANSCTKHKVKLSEFVLIPHLTGRHQFIPASNIIYPSQSKESAHPLDLIISKRIEELLQFPSTPAPTLHQWSQFYQRLARKLGCGKGAIHIDHIKINLAIIKIWDLNWLRQHHLDELHTETSWLNPRCVAEVSFQFNEQNIVILEVDTSDNKKPLSTRVLSLKDMNQWNQTDRSKVFELVITQCLRWPKGIFKNISSKNSTLNHPRMNTKKQEISDSELAHWANRMTLILNANT